MMLKRIINLPIGRNSFFLFGPRQTGKTTLIKELIKNHQYLVINLLLAEEFIKYKKEPSRLRYEIEFFVKKNKNGIIFIDEIQKLPELLDEIHYLIEKYKNQISFILTGSSARKLKRVSTNLLGGRAWSYSLFPFTFLELKQYFSLEHILKYGSLPPTIGLNEDDTKRLLKAYANIYLKEEILDEAIVRNIGAFSKFLELAADNSSEIVNFSNIARETGVASKTIKEYYQILEDTLIAFKLEPFLKSMRKRLIQYPKYYLFDIGVINSLCGRLDNELQSKTYLYGKLFEHFVILEVKRLISYMEKSWKIYFWRTAHGAEVDLIISFPNSRLLAVEIKSSKNVHPKQLTGLKQFLKDFPNSRACCVCTIEKPYLKEGITFLPWRYFFEEELKLTLKTD